MLWTLDAGWNQAQRRGTQWHGAGDGGGSCGPPLSPQHTRGRRATRSSTRDNNAAHHEWDGTAPPPAARLGLLPTLALLQDEGLTGRRAQKKKGKANRDLSPMHVLSRARRGNHERLMRSRPRSQSHQTSAACLPGSVEEDTKSDLRRTMIRDMIRSETNT